MSKVPTVHSTFGPLVATNIRHHYTSMTEDQKTEHDPNDPVKISFNVKDEAMQPWFDKRIAELKDYDPGFYCQVNSWLHGVLYTITTTHRHLEHDEYKKFMFQVKLKLGKNVKIR